MKYLITALFLLCVCAAQPAAAVVPTVDQPLVVLRVLDKMTARVEQMDAEVGKPLLFGNLTITARACRVTPPEETPESAAYFDIVENTKTGGVSPVFQGWMFASSPALSAMEHPIYDLWVIGCKSSNTK